MGSYTFNETVNLQAPLSANTLGENPVLLYFSHWKDVNTGQILSYKASYEYSVFSSKTLEAVYLETAVSAVDTIAITDVLDIRTNHYTVIAQYEKLDTSTILEYGLITFNSYEEFNLNTVGVTTYQSDLENAETHEFLMSIPTDDDVVCSDMVLRDSEDQINVVYSELYNFVAIEIEYAMTSKNLDFENDNPVTWEFWTSEDGSIGYSDIQARDNQSLAMDASSAWQSIGFDGEDYPAKGDTIKLSFYIYVDEALPLSVGGFTIKLLEKTAGEEDRITILYVTQHNSFNANEWVYVETDLGQISLDCDYIQIVMEEGTPHSVYVDDISIIKVIE